jgi:PAS domain S-box-containing protein
MLLEHEERFMTDQSLSQRSNGPASVSENQIVFVIDLAGNFRFVNAAAECVSGYSREEACRMNISDVLAPELKDYVRQQIRGVLQGDFGAVYEIEIITKDRRRVTLETSAQLVMRNGKPFELHGIAFLAVRAGDGEAEVRPRCLDKEFISMLLVPALTPLTNRGRQIINLGSYRPFK